MNNVERELFQEFIVIKLCAGSLVEAQSFSHILGLRLAKQSSHHYEAKNIQLRSGYFTAFLRNLSFHSLYIFLEENSERGFRFLKCLQEG